MTMQAKRTRASVYLLIGLLAVMLPLTGWFARAEYGKPARAEPGAQGESLAGCIHEQNNRETAARCTFRSYRT